jgi:hypothetical protein
VADFMNVPSFFDNLSKAVREDIMTTQLAPNQPEPRQGIFTTSDPVLPDRLVSERLAHLDPDIYDLRDQSHLIKLFKAMLGGAGLGGLRRQAAVARMQSMFNGMHFLDLDRFYGALFGIQRSSGEAYLDQNFNPYLDATDPNTWDEIHSQDASYRSRLIKFARAIPLGATYIGLKTMVEALLGAPCEIYESWALVDEQHDSLSGAPSVLSYTYGLLETTAVTWGGLEGTTWGTWGGGSITQVSRLGFNTRSDFVIQPKREITAPEQYQLTRTVDRFRPAGTSFLIDPMGVALHRDIEPRNVAADSEYWEVTSAVTPNPNLITPPGGIYPTVTTQARPAFSQYQSEAWTYNGDIASVTSYAMMNSDTPLTRGDDEVVTYSDGTNHRYVASDAPMTSAEALSAKLVSDGILTSGAYAPARGLSGRPVIA